ncbi:MAG: response regulator [Treponema sp.]|jgi:PAS domain S-box-containing protein|nr:response regulator [Treponema sp.]
MNENTNGYLNKARKNSVLIVDDENNNIIALTNILKSDYAIYAAKDGRGAIEVAEKHLPDIILLDIIMPDMDGYAVISELRKSEKTKDIPVILITGLSSPEDEEKGLTFGVADYIPKPFSQAIVKLRVGNQMKLLEQFRSNEYDIMKYKLSNDALKIALWDLIIVNGDPQNRDNLKFTWSQEFRDTLGFSGENDFPNTIEALVGRFHPEDEERVKAEFMRHLTDHSGKTPYDTECRAKKKDEEYRYFHVFGTAQRDSNGTPLRMAGAIMDTTEKKEIEEKERKAKIAEESNKAKSRFLATMSHEIRTPMNSIMGFAELALSKSPEPQVRDYLGKITDSTRWLLNIVNDILDISKIESGKMELEHAPFELSDIISRCQSEMQPGITEKGLKFHVYAESLDGKKLVGDSFRLYQALMNLLSNAVKFTSTGAVELSATVISSNSSKATVCFKVKDTGIGMNDGQIAKVFSPFIQADSSTTRNYGGTGLGLTIVKNIVEFMGGKIKVESVPNAGSVFSFEIDFDTIDKLDDANGQNFEILEKPHFEGLVLICDDNPMNQQVICEHLSQIGLKTAVAENGKIGVEMVQERMKKGEKPFDMIFMDIFMPVMDGIEAASGIIALNTGAPIVAMTANIMESDLENYRKNGMLDCIGKPFTSQELWRVLLKYLASSGSPVVVSKNEQEQGDSQLKKKLQINFVKNYQDIITDINEAIDEGDIKLAHRLTHTLKGNAGQIGKTGLQKIAAEIEALLKDGTVPISGDKMDILKNELTLVLEELKPLLSELKPQEIQEPMSTRQIQALFEKLEVMLKNINPESVNFIDELRTISGTEELASQIENYDFETAAETLARLKKRWK